MSKFLTTTGIKPKYVLLQGLPLSCTTAHPHAQHKYTYTPDLVDLKLSVEGDDVTWSILRVLGRLLDTLDTDGDLLMCILAEPVGELTANKDNKSVSIFIGHNDSILTHKAVRLQYTTTTEYLHFSTKCHQKPKVTE